MSDAFEYESALDLNSRAVPFPGKRPYPNPLDGSDANVDFDQDGLPQNVEFLLWQSTGGRLPLTYSDGDQDTNPNGARTATPGNPDLQRLDVDHDGYLSDDEKDADGDLLGNWDEYAGRMQPAWWAGTYKNERQYVGGNGASVLSTTSLVDPDTDGDGVLDGLDDQDHDGYANRDELDRDGDRPVGAPLQPVPAQPVLADLLAAPADRQRVGALRQPAAPQARPGRPAGRAALVRLGIPPRDGTFRRR